MTTPRTREPDFDLLAAAREPHFTPRREDLPVLLGLLGQRDEEVERAAERALLRMGLPIVPALCEAAKAAAPPLRGRVCRLLGRLWARQGVVGAAPDAAAALRQAARGYLLGALGDRDAKTRRNAAIALGRGGGAAGGEDPRAGAASQRDDEIELALLAAWEAADSAELRRTLAASLGKVGGERALALLSAVASEDAELQRIAAQAVVTLSRTLSRPGAAQAGMVVIDDARHALSAPDGIGPLPLWLHCRGGLEALLLQLIQGLGGEAAALLRPRILGAGQVGVELPAQLPAQILRSLLSLRVWTHLCFPLPPLPLPPRLEQAGGADETEALAEAITQTLCGPLALGLLRGYTVGVPRVRLVFLRGGHRRAVMWRCAALLSQRCQEVINDPTGSSWTVNISEQGGGRRPASLRLLLQPRRLLDPRFAYRAADVPAASHPTLAAALAQVAGVRADDVVWDPFVGSGLELCERALLGPCAALYGTDVDPEALAAARANLAGAGVAAERLTLTLGDARAAGPDEATLVISNPPMGRRVHREPDLRELLLAVLQRAVAVLRPGGRLVWISPLPSVTARALGEASLQQVYLQDVDMGGFSGQIQAFVKGERAAAGAKAAAPRPPRSMR